MRDTSPGVAQIQDAIVRGMSGSARLRQALEASDIARELTMTRLRLVFPALPEPELVICLLRERVRGDELPPALR